METEKEKYVLTTFNSNSGTDDDVKSILIKHLQCNLKGASCNGVISLYQFDANGAEVESLVVDLKEDDINYVLVKESNAFINLNKILGSFFNEGKSKRKTTSLKKLSVEDQMNDAIKEQKYELAAVLRDSINKSSGVKTEEEPAPKSVKTKQPKQK